MLKLDCQGKLDIGGRKWKVSSSLAGEYVQVVRVEHRMMVFFCTTLIRELDVEAQRSTIIDRWIPTSATASPL